MRKYELYDDLKNNRYNIADWYNKFDICFGYKLDNSDLYYMPKTFDIKNLITNYIRGRYIIEKKTTTIYEMEYYYKKVSNNDDYYQVDMNVLNYIERDDLIDKRNNYIIDLDFYKELVNYLFSNIKNEYNSGIEWNFYEKFDKYDEEKSFVKVLFRDDEPRGYIKRDKDLLDYKLNLEFTSKTIYYLDNTFVLNFENTIMEIIELLNNHGYLFRDNFKLAIGD